MDPQFTVTRSVLGTFCRVIPVLSVLMVSAVLVAPSALAQVPQLFLPAVTYDSGASGWGSSSVVITDANGDGRPDLIVANCFSENVAILSGNGDGTFQRPVVYSVGDRAASVAVSDLNHDGKVDIVLGKNAAVGVLLGNGDGTFQPTVNYFSSSMLANSIAIADLNNDSNPDVVVEGCTSCGGRSNDVVAVLLGNGDGTFRSAVTYDPGGGEYINGAYELGAQSVAIADMNGDGKLDLLVANLMTCSSCANGSVGVLLGNGDGTFRTAMTSPSFGYYAFSIAVLDANGDGVPDVVVANQASWSITVLLGNGDGSLRLAGTYNPGGPPNSIEVADVNGDGKPDLLVANSYNIPLEIAVMLGNGDGTFQSPVLYDSGAIEAVSVAFADLAGEGMPDLVALNAPGVLGVLMHVGTIPTTTALLSSINPSAFGQVATLSASARSASEAPAGSVTLFDGSTALGTESLTNAIAVIPVSSLTAGSHSITAVYRGSRTFASSASSPLRQVVSVARTMTALGTSINPVVLNKPLKYSARVTGQYSGAVTGTIGFKDGGTTVAIVPLVNGQSAFTTQYSAPGFHVITASYSGDSNNTSSVSGAITEQVTGLPSKTITTLASTLNPSIYGQKVTFMAQVTTSGPVPPTGTVVFMWKYFTTTYTIGTATLNGAGVATLTKSNLNANPYPMIAVYRGDTNNLSSTSAVLNQTVLQTTSAATLTSSVNPSTVGQAITFAAKFTSPTVIPSGPVTFNAGITVLGTAQLSSGKAIFTTSTLPAGSTVVKVIYNGNSNIKGSSASATQTVKP
jgi:uncharacterized protein YuzB (UPF0349 family)